MNALKKIYVSLIAKDCENLENNILNSEKCEYKSNKKMVLEWALDDIENMKDRLNELQRMIEMDLK